MPEYVKNIHKIYPDSIKIIEYNQAWIPTQSPNKQKKQTLKLTTDQQTEIKQQRNIIRAKTKISDIIRCNNFQYFVTLTLKPSKQINRYDYDQSTQALTKYLRYHIKKYILIPEKHKDGAFHFHLLANIPKDQLKKAKKQPKSTTQYFNLSTYKLGHSSAIPIRQGTEHIIANYVQKYITKDLMNTVGFGRKRYWCSKGLNRPHVIYNQPLPDIHALTYEKDHIKIYNAPNLQTQ